MKTFEERFAAAEKAFLQAKDSLALAAADYHQGAGAAYAVALAARDDMLAKVKQNRQEAGPVAENFNREFEVANYEITSKVRSLLAKKTELDLVHDQLKQGLEKREEQLRQATIEASPVARVYQQAHKAAVNARVSWSLLKALRPCAANLGQAMANMVAVDFRTSEEVALFGENEEWAATFLKKEMERLLAEFIASRGTFCEDEALPGIDLGALRMADVMTPVQLNRARATSVVQV
ncbi:hypothetical protein [Ideonella sp. B508-1]|uniref:hypothetical protein n=1 Tax=Ideonella sp. B508-1 TaxID=137716 RepID=UPI00034BE7D8|nr:hypothetical protein [Ideonella sp. B508-1]